MINRFYLVSFFLLFFWTIGSAYMTPREGQKKNGSINFRVECQPGQSSIDLDVNNVRARLLQSGSIFWDGRGTGRYVVPKVDPNSGLQEVSSIFAGGVWIGGLQAGNFRVAAVQYGIREGNVDWYPGPLDPFTGEVDQRTCENWDRHFTVFGNEVQEFLRVFKEKDGAITEEDVPEGVLGWPATGNPFFRKVHGFDLPNTQQGLAGFWDADFDLVYNPLKGDYPIIEIRGCNEPTFPDMMIFWIYNDNGNIHGESNGEPIRMEVQVQSFAFATNDEINNMTFYRYKMINRAPQNIDSMFFANWADPDLGCSEDDYIGSDVGESIGYIYNRDAIDGENGCDCNVGGQATPTYCTTVPMLGIDYFRGPLTPEDTFSMVVPIDWQPPNDGLIFVDEFIELPGDTTLLIKGRRREEIGMSSFMYYVRQGTGLSAPQTDPIDATEYYNYLSGSWRDGTRVTFGGSGYSPGSTEYINYVFPDPPNNESGWSMVTAGLPDIDPRFVQASGPFVLEPGAVNELIVGVVWVPDIPDYPAPSLQPLLQADVAAQGLFDNCFGLLDGPYAPELSLIELDRELIITISNPDCGDLDDANNYNENYIERDIFAPKELGDVFYRFEGYKIYQLENPNVTPSEINDPDKARIVAQVDVKNGISKIFNWKTEPHPIPDSGLVFIPELQVEGADEGIRHSFKITEDQFATGDRRLVNHKQYYYLAVAYAYNNYSSFNNKTGIGQKRLYLEGRRSACGQQIQTYIGIPHFAPDTKLNADYGDGPIVTRVEGQGAGGNNLEVSDKTEQAIIDGSFEGRVEYQEGRAPIEVKVYNPLAVRDGKYLLKILDGNIDDDELNAPSTWELLDASGQIVAKSDFPVERFNEQLLANLGISIALGQTDDVGNQELPDHGMLGLDVEYESEDAPEWYGSFPDDYSIPGIPASVIGPAWDYIKTGPDDPDQQFEFYSKWEGGLFYPYHVANYRPDNTHISPVWQRGGRNGGERVRREAPISQINNVNIVLTADKSQWSRCVVIETAGAFHRSNSIGLQAEGDARLFDLREHPSVGKEDNDNDGMPDPDGEVDENGEAKKGLSWFPGYAYDVETGQRLNIFFGENSIYSRSNFRGQPNGLDTLVTGGDMMFNPVRQDGLPIIQGLDPVNLISGCGHIMYVTNEPYDECQAIYNALKSGGTTNIRSVAKKITWFSFARALSPMLPLSQGLVPNKAKIKLRVENPYATAEPGKDVHNGYPTYEFELRGVQSETIAFEEGQSQLDAIRAVPNPYYGFSSYETGRSDNRIKITNLPNKATITIYSLDGKFIRRYERDEGPQQIDEPTSPIQTRQVNPDLDWDLKNFAGIPIASGVYIIHIDAPGIGERVIKWFGVQRQFDPTGL